MRHSVKAEAMINSDDKGDVDQRRFSRRAMLIGFGQAAALAALGGRLYYLQVLQKDRYASMSDKNRLSSRVLGPARGRIFDRFGVVLADNSDTYRATIIPSLARDVKTVLARFTRIVGISDREHERILRQARRQRPDRPITVATGLTWEQFATINLLASRLPGIRTDVFGRREYFHGRSTGHVVGYVGAVGKRELEDDPVLALPGMRIGLTGVERGMEAALRGSRGRIDYEVDARGRIVRELAKVEPERGRDLVLTIDSQLQAEILGLMQPYRRAAVVVMEVKTGEVVAMLSTPGFEPKTIADGMDGAEWARLKGDGDDPLLNRAIAGQYPPGSTFKLVTALAGLEADLITPASTVTCSGSYTLADRTYRCWERAGHDVVDLQASLVQSCDVYYYELATRLGITRITQMAQRLGLGQAHECGIALQKPGLLPDAAWKRGRYKTDWYGGETLLAAVGQGFVLATPLQLAVMTARIATGRAVKPYLVRNHDEQKVESKEWQAPPLGIREASLAAVRRGMYGAVNADRGTGVKAQLTGGIAVAGKTGTAQVSSRSATIADEALPWQERDHALFVGYLPVSAPRYAVAAVIEHGGSGSDVAALLVRDTMQLLVSRDPIARPAYRMQNVGASRRPPDEGKG